MRPTLFPLLFLLLPMAAAHARNSVPTFQLAAGQGIYTLVGRDPRQAGTTTIPTLLVPVRLRFETKKVAGKSFVLDAAADVSSIEHSPIFAGFAFPRERPTQYADALLRATLQDTPAGTRC